MSVSNKSTTLFQYFLLLSILILTGCTYYKTVQVNNSPEQIASYQQLNKQMVIHDDREQNEFLFSGVKIENDSLTGTFTIAPGKKHYPHKRSFTRGSVKAYPPLSTVHIYTSINVFTTGKVSSIPLSAIKTVEIHKKDKGKGFVVAVLSTVAVVGAILAIACNCPQVASHNENGTQFHGSLFPGSVLKSLKRDDYVILRDPLSSKKGDIKLRISNEDPEHQYIDQLEVLEVAHEGYANLGINNQDQLIAFNEPNNQFKAVTGQAKDITNKLKNQDEQSYAFDEFNTSDKLNEVQLKFDRSTLSDNPTLILRAQQTEWLDTVANFIFYQAGTSQNKWVKRQDNSSPDKWKKRNQKRGLSLNVYLKMEEEWKYVGTHHDVGTSNKRNLLMELDLKNLKSPNIEIKLESAFKIWEIDYVGLTDEWKTNLTTKPLNLLVAENHQGVDAMQQISATDNNYLVQKEIGNYVELLFEAPTSTTFSSVVLHGSGYYHQIIENDHKPNRAFFMKFKKTLGLQDVSRALYQYKVMESANPENKNSLTATHTSN